MKIEGGLGYASSLSKDAESFTKRYYVQCTVNEGPNDAKAALEAFAKTLPVPANLELGDVTLDEEKNANGLYFGAITFKSPGQKIKSKLTNAIEEVYGEKMSLGRKSGSHERVFRIKSNSAAQAGQLLENYIRNAAQTSGRLHISDISVDESQSGDGYFTGRVTYNNPDTFGNRDKLDGVVPAYGTRAFGDKNSRSVERVFEMRGYNSAQEAWNSLYGNYSNDPTVESIDVEEDSSGAHQLFTGRVRFSQEVEYLPTVSFEVSGSQTKMTHSLGTVGGWAANGSPRNYGGLIGVTNDGVEGVDIDTAVSTFCETVYFYPWFLTSSYVAFLARAYGCVNASPFRGFAAGEVRFLGATGSYKQTDTAAELTFKFAVSPNAQGIRIGNMTIPYKEGWDYVWVRWIEKKVNGVTVKVPNEAYVERIYQRLHFGSLGIG